MNQKYINLTDSTLQIKCNHCGNTINIKKGAECRCKYCGQEVDISKCYNYKVSIQSEGYYVYMLQNGIINKDDDMILEASNNLALLSSDNEIFLLIKKRKALKNIEDKKNLDFIVEYLIIQNECLTKEEKIKKIKTTAYKDEYLKRLDDTNEDENIYNNLKDIKVVDLNTHEKKKKEHTCITKSI